MLDLNNPRYAHAEERLRLDTMMWLGTVRPDGRPHLVPVWFVWDGEAILIFSKPDQKIRNLRQNPNVVLALDDTHGGGDVVVIEGTATLPDHDSVNTTLPIYAEKYAAKLKEYAWTAESMSKEYSEAIRITPTKIRAW